MAMRFAAAAVAVVLLAPAAGAHAPQNAVVLFAAASLRTALDELVEPIRATTGVVVRVSYAATSMLARQIEEGAPADIFISADVEWMDYVSTRNLIRRESRVTLLTNRLVLVAPAREPVTLAITPGFGLAGALGQGRLAVADPSAVPAGKYAREALEALGVWASIEQRLAPADNVRAALLLVSRGEAPLGIVYRTDAAADPAVVIVDTFPESTHTPIVYPAALSLRAGARPARVLAFLQTDAARAVFTRQGFGVPGF